MGSGVPEPTGAVSGQPGAIRRRGDLVACILAKLEREKIRERTLAGLARARKEGRTGGRPRLTTTQPL